MPYGDHSDLHDHGPKGYWDGRKHERIVEQPLPKGWLDLMADTPKGTVYLVYSWSDNRLFHKSVRNVSGTLANALTFVDKLDVKLIEEVGLIQGNCIKSWLRQDDPERGYMIEAWEVK
jgi:hypothetical protein